MTKGHRTHPRGSADPDSLLEELLVDAYGEDEQLWAFRQAFEDRVSLPADAFVVGEPVSVTDIDYNGNVRLGLRAACRREDAGEYVVAGSEVVFPEGSVASGFVAAYRRWLGLDPVPETGSRTGRRVRRHKAEGEALDLEHPVELVVLAVKETAARCRIPGSGREITLRSGGTWDLVPGQIVIVKPRKQWRYAGHPYLSGDVQSQRLDVAALNLAPLRLDPREAWDPAEEYWGEEGGPLKEWAQPIVERGSRPAYEMEQILPGADAADEFDDPILNASELHASGDSLGARKILMDLLADDLRCLDAHAHLGSFAFDRRPEEAIRHYEVGVRIGELSLGDGFDGVLLWGDVDNRPFLRCLHGYGLCVWRLGRMAEAERVFERMLWLNPSDNQGARFLLPPIRAGEAWEPDGRG